MTTLTAHLDKPKQSKTIFFLLLLLFASCPFQRRFHGFMDSFSRRLTLPDFPLPEYFSTKVHLFFSDLFILILTFTLLFFFKVKPRKFFWNGPSKYLTLLFFTLIASIYFSITSHYALQYLRALQFSIAFLFFNAICSAHHKIDLSLFIKSLAWTILALSCLECIVGMMQYFHGDRVGLSFLGEPNVQHFHFTNPEKHRWLFDAMNSNTQATHLIRASGTFSHPNILGGFLFFALMSSYYLWMKEDQMWKRSVIFGMLLLQIFTFYITYSRSAMLALVLATFLWCILQSKQIIKQHGFKGHIFKRFALLASIIVLGFVSGTILFFNQIAARGGIFNYNQIAQYADSERIQYLKIAFQMILSHPWLGVGFNNFQIIASPIHPECPGHIFFSKVHNIYLLMAAETGLIGGGLFLAFLFAILKTACKALLHRSQNDSFSEEKIFLFATFIGFLFIGACDFYLLGTQHGRLLFFGFLGLLYAISRVAQNGQETTYAYIVV